MRLFSSDEDRESSGAAKAAGFFVLVFVVAFVARCGWLTCDALLEKRAHAIKPGACVAELERTKDELRLERATLAVVRGQLAACERREGR